MILEMVYYKPRITFAFFCKKSWVLIPPVMGWYFGDYLDRQFQLRYVRFRDKSALYGKKLAEGESPSW